MGAHAVAPVQREAWQEQEWPSLLISLRQALLLFAALFALTASDVGRYEIKEDKSGRTIRLDKWTGEITI
jgi:hypothetical protein